MPNNTDNLAERLSAFADGEVDAAGSDSVLRHVAARPEALTTVEAYRRLSFAARRAASGDEPSVSAELRRRIEAFADDAVPREPRVSRWAMPVPARWLAAAAAVVLLLVGGLIGRRSADRTRPVVVAGVSADDGSVVPASLAQSVTFTHVECSRLPADLHGASVAEIKPGVVRPLELDLHRDTPFPDLTSIGYAFVGAGPCGHPVEDAVHLLYRSTDPGVRDTLSVFVRPFHDGDAAEARMNAGQLYSVVGPDDPHPLLAWRTGRLVYFLVGDAAKPVERARDVIRGAIRL